MLELVLTIVLLIAAFAVRRVSVHDRAGWTRAGRLDHRARALLRAPTRRARWWTARLSDVGLWTMLVYPGWIDGLALGPAVGADGVRVFIVDLEAFTALAIVMFVMQRWVARERPYASYPDRAPYEPIYPERFRSFFSGHAAATATGASLLWLHHLRVPGYGEPWHLAVTLAATGVAVVVAWFRVRADRHWLSDVLAGAVVGVACGWLVPLALHGLPGRLLDAVP